MRAIVQVSGIRPGFSNFLPEHVSYLVESEASENNYMTNIAHLMAIESKAISFLFSWRNFRKVVHFPFIVPNEKRPCQRFLVKRLSQ